VIDAAELFGIILHIITGNVLGAVVSSVSANLRSPLTGELPPGVNLGGIDVCEFSPNCPDDCFCGRRDCSYSLPHLDRLSRRLREEARHSDIPKGKAGALEDRQLPIAVYNYRDRRHFKLVWQAELENHPRTVRWAHRKRQSL